MFVLFLFLRKISDYLQKNCLLLYKILRRMRYFIFSVRNHRCGLGK